MKLLKLLVFFGLSISAGAQTNQVILAPNGTPVSANNSASNIPGCITDLLHNQQMQNSAIYNQRMQAMNNAILNFDNASRGGVLTIPVVIHIIHNNGPENISDAQVIQGISDLNLAFDNGGMYANPGGVYTNIQFCLAKQDPQGNFTTGINRVVSTLTNMTSETQDLELKNLSRWDPTKYLNIWLVKEISSLSMGSGMAGYAYYPAAHGTPIDGIVNEANLFGSTIHNSKVHIHEAGHYLGLMHTFDGGCVNNNCQTDGDKVCDTPPDNSSAPDMFCAYTYNTCSTDDDDLSVNNPFRPTANGGIGDQPDPFENYMDYGLQLCQKWFSQGQSDRMNAALTTTRASLLNSLVCLNPCVNNISTSFTSSDTTIYAGDPITFTVQNPSAATYTWKINGVQVGTGNPFTYNNFSQLGEYVVELTGTNGDPSCANSTFHSVFVECQAQAAFTMAPNSPYPVGTTISAINFSVNATTIGWYLDGVYVNGNLNFSQQFNTPGSHSLFLVATIGGCSDTSEAKYFSIGNCNISGMNNHWVFPGHTMDFTNGEPTATYTSPNFNPSQEITTSICDPNGDLLFFSDGMNVWDKNHNLMPNGTGLLGNPSTTQGCLATPFPGNSNLYYIFTLDGYENNYDNGLRYSIVDMTLNNGLGAVILNSKNTIVSTTVGEMLTATFHANGHDIWIACNKENGNTYYTYLLTSQGISTTPVESVLGTYSNDIGLGCMKFSPSGNKMAATTIDSPRSILVADFNRATGEFYNDYNIPIITNAQPHSLEFSPDNSKLYVQGWSTTELVQYNLAAGGLINVINSKYVVNPAPATFGVLCRGNNGKIYTASSSSGKIDFIANPNVAGAGCNYTVGQINSVGSGGSATVLPNMMQGLNEAYIPSINGKLNICLGETVNYNVPYLTSDQSVLWTFVGNGTFTNSGNTATLSNLNGQGLIKIKVTGNCGISYDSIHVQTVQPVQVHLQNDTAVCGDLYLAPTPQGVFTDYLWNTGSIATSIMATPSGTFWVETTDINGCVDRDSISIASTSTNAVDLGEDEVICGENITLNAGAGYDTYQWQNGSTSSTFLATQPGTYWVTVTDDCGSSTDSLTITAGSVNFNLNYNGASTVCKSSLPFTLNAPSGYDSYLWQNGSVASSIFITTIGTYYVTVTDENGCSGIDTLYVLSCAGVEENNAMQINIYPIPASENFKIELSDESTVQLFIYDATGKIVFSQQFSNNTIVNTLTYATGVYTLEIRGDNKIWRQKVIVMH